MSKNTTQKNTQPKIPKLRFPGFEGVWEEKRLGEIGKSYNGLSGKTAEDFGEGKPFITYKQIFDSSEININNFAFVNVRHGEKQNKAEFGDLFFTTSSETPLEVGFASVFLNNDINPYLNSFSFGFRFDSLKEFDPYFAKFFFRTSVFRREVVKLAQGSTRYNISKIEFMKMKFGFPQLPEQQKIASFLGLVDEWLENLQTQKQNLEQYKKGIMQQIFSQKIRFTDENGNDFADWEEKRLGEVGEIATGTTPSTSNPNYYGGDLPWITPTDINENKNIFSSAKLLTKLGLEKGRFIPKNSLLVTCIASIGKNAILRVDGSCNQQINAITPNIDNNIDFLYYLINKENNTLLRFASAGGMAILNKTDFSKLKFKFPSLAEQQKIAEFLSSVDDLIESKQQQITQAEGWKKGLMQGLFV